jgi:hypothetical protein
MNFFFFFNCRKMLGLSLVLLLAHLASNPVSSQSNYALQAIDVEYGNAGLPPTAILDGKVTELDTLKSQVSLNRTSADLNCAAGSMLVQLKFKEPFYGIAYSDFDRNSACHTQGAGDITAVLELPLKGCGTKQVSRFSHTFLIILYYLIETEKKYIGYSVSMHLIFGICINFSSEESSNIF